MRTTIGIESLQLYAGTQNAPRSRCNTHINIQCARGQTLAAGASIPMPIACRASRMRLFASADSIPSLQQHRRHAMPPQNQCHSTTWLHVVSRIASLRQCAQHCRRPLASPAAATPFPPTGYLAGAGQEPPRALEPPSSGKAPELAPFQTARRRSSIDILGLRRRIPSHKWRSGQCMNEWLQLLTTVRTDSASAVNWVA